MSGAIIELVEKTQSFRKKLIVEIRRVIKKASPKFVRGIEIDVRNYLVDIMKKTDTYDALVNGRLAGHFGFPKGQAQQMVDDILEKLQEEVVVSYDKDGVHIGIAEEGYEALIKHPAAYVITERGEKLPWLEWLLLHGTKVIIADYQIVFREGLDNSRSGQAIMIALQGKTWGVPEEYAGTENNNWITQSILETRESIVQQLESIVEENIKKAL